MAAMVRTRSLLFLFRKGALPRIGGARGASAATATTIAAAGRRTAMGYWSRCVETATASAVVGAASSSCGAAPAHTTGGGGRSFSSRNHIHEGRRGRWQPPQHRSAVSNRNGGRASHAAGGGAQQPPSEQWGAADDDETDARVAGLFRAIDGGKLAHDRVSPLVRRRAVNAALEGRRVERASESEHLRHGALAFPSRPKSSGQAPRQVPNLFVTDPVLRRLSAATVMKEDGSGSVASSMHPSANAAGAVSHGPQRTGYRDRDAETTAGRRHRPSAGRRESASMHPCLQQAPGRRCPDAALCPYVHLPANRCLRLLTTGRCEAFELGGRCPWDHGSAETPTNAQAAMARPHSKENEEQLATLALHVVASVFQPNQWVEVKATSHAGVAAHAVVRQNLDKVVVSLQRHGRQMDGTGVTKAALVAAADAFPFILAVKGDWMYVLMPPLSHPATMTAGGSSNVPLLSLLKGMTGTALVDLHATVWLVALAPFHPREVWSARDVMPSSRVDGAAAAGNREEEGWKEAPTSSCDGDVLPRASDLAFLHRLVDMVCDSAGVRCAFVDHRGGYVGAGGVDPALYSSHRNGPRTLRSSPDASLGRPLRAASRAAMGHVPLPCWTGLHEALSALRRAESAVAETDATPRQTWGRVLHGLLITSLETASDIIPTTSGSRDDGSMAAAAGSLMLPLLSTIEVATLSLRDWFAVAGEESAAAAASPFRTAWVNLVGTVTAAWCLPHVHRFVIHLTEHGRSKVEAAGATSAPSTSASSKTTTCCFDDPARCFYPADVSRILDRRHDAIYPNLSSVWDDTIVCPSRQRLSQTIIVVLAVMDRLRPSVGSDAFPPAKSPKEPAREGVVLPAFAAVLLVAFATVVVRPSGTIVAPVMSRALHLVKWLAASGGEEAVGAWGGGGGRDSGGLRLTPSPLTALAVAHVFLCVNVVQLLLLYNRRQHSRSEGSRVPAASGPVVSIGSNDVLIRPADLLANKRRIHDRRPLGGQRDGSGNAADEPPQDDDTPGGPGVASGSPRRNDNGGSGNRLLKFWRHLLFRSAAPGTVAGARRSTAVAGGEGSWVRFAASSRHPDGRARSGSLVPSLVGVDKTGAFVVEVADGDPPHLRGRRRGETWSQAIAESCPMLAPSLPLRHVRYRRSVAVTDEPLDGLSSTASRNGACLSASAPKSSSYAVGPQWNSASMFAASTEKKPWGGAAPSLPPPPSPTTCLTHGSPLPSDAASGDRWAEDADSKKWDRRWDGVVLDFTARCVARQLTLQDGSAAEVGAAGAAFPVSSRHMPSEEGALQSSSS